MKKHIRQLLQFLHLDLTKNLAYDRLTTKVLQRILKSDSNCIDVGAHKGEVLEKILAFAPQGRHYAFEPIPHLHQVLQEQFGERVHIYSHAIADKDGVSSFQHVRNAAAFSGIKERSYDITKPQIDKLMVTTRTLDGLIPVKAKIGLMKIDVEGGEYEVLLGAKNMLIRDQPAVIFECGKGGIDYYGNDSNDVWQFLSELRYDIFTLKAWLEDGHALSRNAFNDCFQNESDYYFLAVGNN